MVQGALMRRGPGVPVTGGAGPKEIGVEVGAVYGVSGLVPLEPVGWRERGGVPCPKRGEVVRDVGAGWLLSVRKSVEARAAVAVGGDWPGRGRRGVWLRWRWCSSRRC